MTLISTLIVIAIIIIVIVIVFRIINRGISTASQSVTNLYTIKDLPFFDEPDEETWHWSHNTAHFNLRGLKHYNSQPGHYESYIVAQTNNPYDKYAIVVVTREKQILGYLPKGNDYLHNEITKKYGRYLPVNVMIKEGYDEETLFGYVDICLETYPDLDVRKMILR